MSFYRREPPFNVPITESNRTVRRAGEPRSPKPTTAHRGRVNREFFVRACAMPKLSEVWVASDRLDLRDLKRLSSSRPAPVEPEQSARQGHRPICRCTALWSLCGLLKRLAHGNLLLCDKDAQYLCTAPGRWRFLHALSVVGGPRAHRRNVHRWPLASSHLRHFAKRGRKGQKLAASTKSRSRLGQNGHAACTCDVCHIRCVRCVTPVRACTCNVTPYTLRLVRCLQIQKLSNTNMLEFTEI